MIQLIVVAASILLGLVLYPILSKAYFRFIENQYKNLKGELIRKPPETIQKQVEKPSFVGESKLNLRQSKPKAATGLETEKLIEKVPTFVPPTDNDPEIKDVEVPLEKVENLSEEEFDDESETEELDGLEPGAVLASGVVYEDLAKTQQVIAVPVASQQEEKDAGKVIYQNLKTDMFEQLAASANTRIAMRISNLLDIHLGELAKEQQAEKQMSEKRNKQLDSSDFKDFDINSIF